VTISYHKNDADNSTQPWTARLINGIWQKSQIRNWPWHWDFHGDDTQNFAIIISPVVKRNDGDLTHEFNHIIFGNGTWSIDPETMRAIGKLQRETISPSLLKVKGTFPGLEVRLVEDSGQYDITDTRFYIRWKASMLMPILLVLLPTLHHQCYVCMLSKLYRIIHLLVPNFIRILL
jgi:hypothetical protein